MVLNIKLGNVIEIIVNVKAEHTGILPELKAETSNALTNLFVTRRIVFHSVLASKEIKNLN